MGSGHSQEDYEWISLNLYNRALQQPCLLPDVGIDESLLKYSGLDSNSQLQTYSDELVTSVPGYVEKLGSSLASFSSIPNAVGLGALVISMIIELIIKSSTQTKEDSYSMLRRVFGEEKASAVRDTVSTYLWRHQMFMKNDPRLREELKRLEQQLSNNLNILKNSLLHDGQMSSRGFKIWVNGASFHLQMLIHEARLNTRTHNSASDYVDQINVAIKLYLQDLERLLENYKTYKMNNISIHKWISIDSFTITCEISNPEANCVLSESDLNGDPHKLCGDGDHKVIEAFMNHVYSKYEPITSLKSHFLNIKNHLSSLINQHDVFIVPSAA